MTTYIVTIKDPKNPRHNPHNKVTSECTRSDVCTDSTGEHHSFIVETELSPGEVIAAFRSAGTHVTRVEQARVVVWDAR